MRFAEFLDQVERNMNDYVDPSHDEIVKLVKCVRVMINGIEAADHWAGHDALEKCNEIIK